METQSYVSYHTHIGAFFYRFNIFYRCLIYIDLYMLHLANF